MQSNDGIVVENVCYKLLYRVGVKVNYETERSLCAYHGMGMAKFQPSKLTLLFIDMYREVGSLHYNQPTKLKLRTNMAWIFI